MRHWMGPTFVALGLTVAAAACGSESTADVTDATDAAATETSPTAASVAGSESTAPDGGESSTSVAATSAAATSGAAVTDRALRVGLVTTLSGPAGYYGQDILDGFNLAVEQSGANIEVIVEDDEQDAEVGLRAATRLLDQEDVDVVTGTAFSNVILVVAPDVIEAGKIFLGPNGGPSQYAGSDCNPLFFNVAFQTDALAESIGQHMSDAGVQNPYIVTVDYQAGYDAVAGVKRTYGGDAAGEQYVPLGTTDFAAVIAEINASNADSLFVFLPGGPGIAFMQQYADTGNGLQMYATPANADEVIVNVVGEASLGILASTSWGYDLDNPVNQRFVEAFVEKYDRKPEIYAMQGYDAGQLLGGSLEVLGGVPDDINDLAAVMRTAPFESPRGDFAFGANQFPIQDWYVREIVQGEGGAITYTTGAAVLEEHADAYAADCPAR